jgi:hypothetical protein
MDWLTLLTLGYALATAVGAVLLWHELTRR